MLLSMTGFGDSRHQSERISASVEVRAVNNRYLKIVTRCADVYAALEGEIERIVRESVGRGTINVTIRVDRRPRPEDYVINLVALQGYWSQLQFAARDLQTPAPDLGHLLALPGVVAEDLEATADVQADWATIRPLLEQALEKLHVFRVEEGRSMERGLLENVDVIAERLETVAELAPQVVTDYRTRLLERVGQLLADGQASVSETDLIREISIFAERADIHEEITRLRSHLQQFAAFLNEPASAGRKLDFLSQEMVREVNTIGSKANHVGIARCVVEMKAAIEKIREILQNVE